MGQPQVYRKMFSVFTLFQLFKLKKKKNSVAVSAAITTPLDVAKTRIMLSSTDKKEVRISTMLKEVYREAGPRG